MRGVEIHVRRWGDPEAPLLVLCHGWMDMSATFQFVVDALQGDWHVVAPDWPGFGRSPSRGRDQFLISRIADLDAIARIYSPDHPIRLVGHSLGAQISTLYLGARPERVLGFVSLDGVGPHPPHDPDSELTRLRRWLAHAAQDHAPRVYESTDALQRALMNRNPRLTAPRAEFLAREFAAIEADGRARLLVDRDQNPGGSVPRFTQATMNAALAGFQGSVLYLMGKQSRIRQHYESTPSGQALLNARLTAAPRASLVELDDAGHNVHHDAPEQVARWIEAFFRNA